MGSGDKNDRKRLAALTFVKARGGCEAVLAPHPTEFARVKMPFIEESSP
jgi:NAD(P)H-hydrate repair Nnr-like enzyme with NAD(P)H-hydrate dehydratase domain